MEALLTRRSLAALALGAALLALALPASAAGPLATIKGRIVNDKGVPITGAYLYVSTPEGLGLTNFITSKTGRYHIVGLMRGKYTVIVEAPGFKTVRIERVSLSAGSTVTLNFKMQPTAIEEETITLPPGPTLNRDSPVTTVVLDKNLVSRLPMPRDFTGILGLVPGLAYEIDSPGLPKSMQGEPALANQLEQDGISVAHPINASEMGRINIDIVDEVVIEMAGHAADSGPVQGGHIAVIFPPGAASTDMELSYGVSGKGLVNSLWTEEELAEMPGATPTTLRREHDLSFTLGGPVLEEMAWFYGNLRFKSQGRRAPYSYWTDPQGVRHFVYDYMEKDLGGLFKLTMSVMEKFKGALEVGFSGVREPVYSGDITALRPEAATRELDGERLTYARAAGSYIVNQATRVTMSFGYAKQRLPLRLNSMGTEKPEYYDVITGRSWGSGTLNDYRTAKRARVGASLTRFLDGFLGFPHELSLGGEYETTTGTSSTWKADNLIHSYADGSPYTYGQTTSPSSGNTVGWGLVGFYIAPGAEGSLSVKSELKRLGGYVQDTVKLFDRVSLSAGLRFDRSEARLASLTKAESGNALSVQLGGSLIDPVMGYNPYSSMSLPAWDKNIVWDSLSPRVGLVVDILGRGATLLKASWAKLPEYLGLGYSEDLSQIDPRAAHAFLWFDENTDGEVGSADAFSLVSYDFRVYKSEFYSQSIDPKLSAPVIEEFSAGLEQQLARDFTLSARYTVRTHTNNIGHTLYDPSTGVSWARFEDSPEGWWVPFSTVVPGGDAYEDVPATVYFPATSAPSYFERIENVPELEARYKSLEIIFQKRMSRNWQLFGSVAWNRSTGTTNLASRWSAGTSSVLLTPNAFTNIAATDTLLQDRPFIARLAGTVRFSGDFYASLFLKVQSGAPWGRTVTVIPPSDWAAENGAKVLPTKIYLEDPGGRRYESWKNLDIRLEKEFLKAGRRTFSISVDVLNLLGDKYRTLDLNDGGTWRPDGEGSSTGTRILSGTYQTYWPEWGSRVIRFNFKLGF